ADRFEYVFKKFRANNVSVEDVQKLIDGNALAWFSLTAHPTNPTSLEYTLRGLEVDKVLGSPSSSGEDFKKVLEGLIVGRKDGGQLNEKDLMVNGTRTVADEVEEAMAVMDVIYESVPVHKTALRRALDKYGYSEVEINHPLV